MVGLETDTCSYIVKTHMKASMHVKPAPTQRHTHFINAMLILSWIPISDSFTLVPGTAKCIVLILEKQNQML